VGPDPLLELRVRYIRVLGANPANGIPGSARQSIASKEAILPLCSALVRHLEC